LKGGPKRVLRGTVRIGRGVAQSSPVLVRREGDRELRLDILAKPRGVGAAGPRKSRPNCVPASLSHRAMTSSEMTTDAWFAART
jgi:hypothetical protein